MAKTDSELARFLAGQPVDIGAVLRGVKRGDDLALAVRAVLSLIDHPHWFFGSCADLPAGVIRGVLAADHPTPSHLFVQVAVPTALTAAALRAAWRRAADVLAILADTTIAFESEVRRAMLAKLATEPAILAAIQAVAARATAKVSLDMLAVLVLDGGDASIDALVPHLGALASPDARLERLARLRPLARRTPALDALFAEIGTAVADYRRTAPALALATRLGLAPDPQGVFWFHFLPMSERRTAEGIPLVQGRVRVDSREERWLSVRISRVAVGADRGGDRETIFDDVAVARDELELGRCDAIDLPAWLATAARKLSISWHKHVVTANVVPSAPLTRWLAAK